MLGLSFRLILLIVSLTRLTEADCPFRYYGDGCTQRCGHCTGNASCEATSGKCNDGCDKGWKEPLCKISYPMLRNPPNLKTQNKNCVVVSWKRWLPTKDIGEGSPKSYLVQLMNISDRQWKTFYEISANGWSEVNDGFEVTLTNVSLTTPKYLRVVVVDSSGEAQMQSVPVLHLAASEIEEKAEVPMENDALYDLKAVFYDWLMWTGVAIVAVLILGIIIICVVECRDKEKKRNNPDKFGRLELTQTNSGEYNTVHGQDNSGYVTLRTESVRNVKANLKPDTTPNKVDWTNKDKSKKLHSVRSNQIVSSLYTPGRWREALPGLQESRDNQDSGGSWYTEWYDSRMYENHREAPEEVTVDQTRSMNTIPCQ